MLLYICLFCVCGHKYHGACVEAKGQLVGIFSLFLSCRVWGLSSGWWQVPLHTKSSGQPRDDTFLHTNPFKVKTCHRYQFSNFPSAQSITGIYSHHDRQQISHQLLLVSFYKVSPPHKAIPGLSWEPRESRAHRAELGLTVTLGHCPNYQTFLSSPLQQGHQTQP